MQHSYFLFNGEEVNPDENIFSSNSRVYRYGDGFFESMRYCNHRLFHLPLHVIRIRKSAMLLEMKLPALFDEMWLEETVKNFCYSKNLDNAFVRCTFLRETTGRYLPEGSGCSTVIEITPASEIGYPINENGMILGSYSELTKNANYTSTLKSTSSLTYVMASIYAAKNHYDDVIIFNDFGRIAETSRANIFVVSGDFITTPPLSEYCIDGVMRKVVMQTAQAYGYTVAEQPLTEIFLQSADEAFTTNAARGIQWIAEFKMKKYKHTCSKVLSELINKHE